MDIRVRTTNWQKTTSPHCSHRLTTTENRYDPTIEDSYSVTRTLDGQTYQLNLTDTAGQEEYRGLWAASNLRSDAFLLVYDITNANSLDSLAYFHELISMEEDQRLDTGGVPPVKIVAGNKCDLKEERQIRSQQGLEWARARRCGFMETSAREMVNIEETFACMCFCDDVCVSRVRKTDRIYLRSDRPSCSRTAPSSPQRRTPGSKLPRSNDASRTLERETDAQHRPRSHQAEERKTTFLEQAEVLVAAAVWDR
jgi:small GTP-binding protein